MTAAVRTNPADDVYGGMRSPARADGGEERLADRVLVLNPQSGDGNHAAEVRQRAIEHGFAVHETEAAGDAIDLAARAVANGAEFVAAAGGDGTLNEVVYGLYRAGGLEDVTFGVVPTGTGNNFAQNVGVDTVPAAFDVLASGERRRIDLGRVRPTEGSNADFDGERVFLNSCVAGFTAEASKATTTESKERFGVVAYVLETLRTMSEFEPMRLLVATDDEDTWDGEAVSVLIGNGRRFPVEGRTQADMEDGLLDVTIVRERPTVELVGEAAASRLFGGETENIHRLKSSALTLVSEDNTAIPFSLDGEMVHTDGLRVETVPNALELAVGGAYEPDPDA